MKTSHWLLELSFQQATLTLFQIPNAHLIPNNPSFTPSLYILNPPFALYLFYLAKLERRRKPKKRRKVCGEGQLPGAEDLAGVKGCLRGRVGAGLLAEDSSVTCGGELGLKLWLWAALLIRICNIECWRSCSCIWTVEFQSFYWRVLGFYYLYLRIRKM